MTKEDLKHAINESLIYHSDDGTSGYILSDKQLDAILDKVDRYVGEVIGQNEYNNRDITPMIRNNLRAEMRKRAGL